MHYDQTSPLDARYHEREVDISDSTDERMSSDRIHLLRPRATHRSAFKNPSDIGADFLPIMSALASIYKRPPQNGLISKLILCAWCRKR